MTDETFGAGFSAMTDDAMASVTGGKGFAAWCGQVIGTTVGALLDTMIVVNKIGTHQAVFYTENRGFF